MSTGLYLYCVIPDPGPRTFSVSGLRNSELSIVSHDGFAIVVGSSPEEKYRVNREDTMAHYRVNETIMKEFPILPIKYGTIAKKLEDIVERVLKPRKDEFKELLEWISSKEEIGVKAYWSSMENVYQKIRESSAELQAIAARVSHLSEDASYYDRIEAGRLVQKLLTDHRDATKQKILEQLATIAVKYVENPPYGDEMAANAPFLVEKFCIDKFETEVQNLRIDFASELTIRLLKNCVPYNFVKVVIEWGDDYVST